MNDEATLIGVVTRGSLIEGIEMKLDTSQDVEDVKAGKFVVIRGKKSEFFSMITDMRLDATNPGDSDQSPRRRGRVSKRSFEWSEHLRYGKSPPHVKHVAR